MHVHGTWPTPKGFGEGCGDDSGPFLSPGHVTGPVAGGQQRAVAHTCRRWVSDLTGGQRRHRLIETGEAFAEAPLHHQRVTAVGQGPNLELGVVELARVIQRDGRGRLKTVDGARLTCDHGKLEVALFDTATLLLEQPAAAGHPTLAHDSVSEPGRVQVSQGCGDQRRPSWLTDLFPLTERQLKLAPRAHQVVVEEQQTPKQLTRRRVREEPACAPATSWRRLIIRRHDVSLPAPVRYEKQGGGWGSAAMVGRGSPLRMSVITTSAGSVADGFRNVWMWGRFVRPGS